MAVAAERGFGCQSSETPFRVGDRVRIGVRGNGDAEGEVLQISWRSTRNLTDDNDVAILPNSLVAKADIVNHSVPRPLRTRSIAIPIDPHAVPERVIEKLEEATLLLPEILPNPPLRAMLSAVGLEESLYAATFAVGAACRLDQVRDRFLSGARPQLLGLRFPAATRIAPTATARTHATALRLPGSAMAPLVTANAALAAALERAVHCSLEILERSAAAQVAAQGVKRPLPARIHTFFGIVG